MKILVLVVVIIVVEDSMTKTTMKSCTDDAINIVMGGGCRYCMLHYWGLVSYYPVSFAFPPLSSFYDATCSLLVVASLSLLLSSDNAAPMCGSHPPLRVYTLVQMAVLFLCL